MSSSDPRATLYFVKVAIIFYNYRGDTAENQN